MNTNEGQFKKSENTKGSSVKRGFKEDVNNRNDIQIQRVEIHIMYLW